jgi:hypothetical protein
LILFFKIKRSSERGPNLRQLLRGRPERGVCRGGGAGGNFGVDLFADGLSLN